MPKITITNNQMLAIRKEIIEYRSKSLTFALFNSEKIERFYKRNKLRLDAADNKIKHLVRHFVKHNDTNTPIMKDSPGHETEFEFLDENAEKAFTVEWQEFMNRNIEIEY